MNFCNDKLCCFVVAFSPVCCPDYFIFYIPEFTTNCCFSNVETQMVMVNTRDARLSCICNVDKWLYIFRMHLLRASRHLARRRAVFAAAGVRTNCLTTLPSQRAFQQSQSAALGGWLICFICDSSLVGNENTACLSAHQKSTQALLPSVGIKNTCWER